MSTTSSHCRHKQPGSFQESGVTKCDGKKALRNCRSRTVHWPSKRSPGRGRLQKSYTGQLRAYTVDGMEDVILRCKSHEEVAVAKCWKSQLSLPHVHYQTLSCGETLPWMSAFQGTGFRNTVKWEFDDTKCYRDAKISCSPDKDEDPRLMLSAITSDTPPSLFHLFQFC